LVDLKRFRPFEITVEGMGTKGEAMTRGRREGRREQSHAQDHHQQNEMMKKNNMSFTIHFL
jgi:hypothetical protein